MSLAEAELPPGYSLEQIEAFAAAWAAAAQSLCAALQGKSVVRRRLLQGLSASELLTALRLVLVGLSQSNPLPTIELLAAALNQINIPPPSWTLDEVLPVLHPVSSWTRPALHLA